MRWSFVGVVTHYFDRIGVAVLELHSDLVVGDWIGFVRNDDLLFEQEVSSMQIEHENVEYAKAGDSIGLKVSRAVKEGTEVYLRVE